MDWPGSRTAVERLVAECYDDVFRFAYRLAGNAADAEDLAQDAFCRAQMQWHQLRDPAKAKAWLFRIARNCYLQRRRGDHGLKSLSLECAGDLPEPGEPAGDIDPERLQAVLDELPEAFRTPLILFYFEEFSYRDIADQLDLPIGTVMSRLARAKGFLRRRLEELESPAERGASRDV